MNISDCYINALLAQAAYAEELTDGLKGESLANRLFGALKDKGMTKAQADYIGENFEVVTQQDTTDSGFQQQFLRGFLIVVSTFLCAVLIFRAKI